MILVIHRHHRDHADFDEIEMGDGLARHLDDLALFQRNRLPDAARSAPSRRSTFSAAAGCGIRRAAWRISHADIPARKMPIPLCWLLDRVRFACARATYRGAEKIWLFSYAIVPHPDLQTVRHDNTPYTEYQIRPYTEIARPRRCNLLWKTTSRTAMPLPGGTKLRKSNATAAMRALRALRQLSLQPAGGNPAPPGGSCARPPPTCGRGPE